MNDEDRSGEARSGDVVLLHSPTEDGSGVRVVRAREGRVELGEVRPLAEGKPIAGEVVTLTPRPSAPRVCDVQVHAAAPAAARTGPAQVATDTYRSNWDAIFGEKTAAGAALN